MKQEEPIPEYSCIEVVKIIGTSTNDVQTTDISFFPEFGLKRDKIHNFKMIKYRLIISRRVDTF